MNAPDIGSGERATAPTNIGGAECNVGPPLTTIVVPACLPACVASLPPACLPVYLRSQGVQLSSWTLELTQADGNQLGYDEIGMPSIYGVFWAFYALVLAAHVYYHYIRGECVPDRCYTHALIQMRCVRVLTGRDPP